MNAMVKETRPIRVLLVEDEFLISELVAESLAGQGFCVRTVSNGTDALRHLASSPVDILFTDVNLAGGMDGTTLAQRAREMRPDLPVVYASGRVNVLDLATSVPHSVFVAKPYDLDVIGRLLASAVKAGAARLPA